MTHQATSPQATLQAGAELHGFKVLRVEVLPEIRVTAYEIEHKKTGAKVLHLHSLDRENLYAIGFRTPPADSTGLPHILEHSVLAGYRDRTAEVASSVGVRRDSRFGNFTGEAGQPLPSPNRA